MNERVSDAKAKAETDTVSFQKKVQQKAKEKENQRFYGDLHNILLHCQFIE